jgi:predicted Zn-dependent protease with MMP-like domain
MKIFAMERKGRARAKKPGGTDSPLPPRRREPLTGRVPFEKLVREAVEALPPELKDQLENVAILVEEEPPPDALGEEGWPGEDQDLLGLYHGVSRKERGFWYGNALPDRIVIYRQPLEAISASLEELRKNVRETVFHEVGHYFGFDEQELRDLEEGVDP